MIILIFEERIFEWYIRPFSKFLYGLNEFITIFTNQKEYYTHDQTYCNVNRSYGRSIPLIMKMRNTIETLYPTLTTLVL